MAVTHTLKLPTSPHKLERFVDDCIIYKLFLD